MASSALKGKNVLVNGAWGAGAALARHARAKGANVAVIFDALEARFLGKTDAEVDAAKQALLGETSETSGATASGSVQVLDCDSSDLDTLKACCSAAGAAAGVDVLVHHSALEDTRGLLELPADVFTAMQDTTLRRSFWATRYAMDVGGLGSKDGKSGGGHVLSVAPPLHLNPATFLEAGVGHCMARFNQSMATLGLAEELKREGVAVNAVWPAAAGASGAAAEEGADVDYTALAAAAEWVVGQDVADCAGNFFTDLDVVAAQGGDGASDAAAAAAATPRSVFLPSGLPPRGVPLADGRGDHFPGRMPAADPANDVARFAAFTASSSSSSSSSPPPPQASLRGKTLFVTGGSRGIGLAIAKRAAADGANVVLAAKTDTPHPTLPGTIHTAAAECVEAGAGGALALKLNIQDDSGIQEAVEACVAEFGGIDILINNASAIDNSGSLRLKEKKYDLMHSINSRGTHLMTQRAMPHLLQAEHAHVLNISPPLDFDPIWFRMCGVGYTIAKYNMSLSACGLAEEFRAGGAQAVAHGSNGVAFNCLWPRTAIATAAMDMLAGKLARHTSRTVDIMSDAAHWILTRDVAECTGNYFIDDDIARYALRQDLDQYRYSWWSKMLPLMPDFFVGDPVPLERLFDMSRSLRPRR